MKRKIILSLIVSAISIFASGMICVSAETYGDLTYYVSSNKVTITDCTSSVTEVEIPKTIKGYPVISIGDSAFEDCTNLVSITIPDSVTSIGVGAFYGCSGLTSVDITDIGAWCKINFANSRSNPLSYAKNLYINGNFLTSIIIPDSVTSIGDYVFYNCDSLTSISIPDSVTTIGDDAFYECSSLNSITIPDSITSIGDYAFYECNSLTKVDITDVEAWCKINFASSYSNPLYYSKNLYLNGNLITRITVPNGVTSIGNYVFYNCDSLTSITIPNSVTSIGNFAFLNCNNLTSITISDNVTSIGDYVFYNCDSLISITIPDGVTSIGETAFGGCSSLTSITIPDSVTSIGEKTFYSCDNLKYVCLPAEVLYIRNDAFNYCPEIEKVFYEGTKEQWESVLKYNRNENLTDAEIIYEATKRTYKFETNCENSLKNITDYAVFTAPIVENKGKILQGWYDNKELSGEAVTFPYYGNATILYAAWSDRTGTNYADAFIIGENEKYTVTTTTSNQFVYFEFVPSQSKEYRFYSTGGLDTYGYLYDSNEYRISSNDDSGDGNNFYISYKLTAGETYYIVVKSSNVIGTFTLVAEKTVEYKINSITIKDTSGNELLEIPDANFLATVSVTNISSDKDTMIVLAQYSASGVFKGLMYVSTEDIPTGSTFKLTLPVDNTKGDIAVLKAFSVASFNSLVPMGNSVSFPIE